MSQPTQGELDSLRNDQTADGQNVDEQVAVTPFTQLSSRVVDVVFMDHGVEHGILESIDAFTRRIFVRRAADNARLNVPFDRIHHIKVIGNGSIKQQGNDFQRLVINYKDGSQETSYVQRVMSDDVGLQLSGIMGDETNTLVIVPQTVMAGYSMSPYRRPDSLEDSEAKAAGAISSNTAKSSAELNQLLNKEMIANKNELGKLLVEGKIIDQQQLRDALDIQEHLKKYKKLGEILEEEGGADAAKIHAALARKFGMPFVRLSNFDLDPEAIDQIPEDFAHKYGVMPIMFHEGALIIAIEDPADTEVVDMARFRSGKHVEAVLAMHDELAAAIVNYYGIGDNLELAQLEQNLMQDRHRDIEVNEEDLGKKAPIVKVVNNMILDAIRRNVSDIHMRPREEDTELLYRIDGQLIPIKSFSRALLPALISRIKIIGNMDVTEHRLPQDGRSRAVGRDSVVDLRISVIPTINGESAVIRLLNTSQGLRAISEIGLGRRDQELFVDLLHRNNGVLLVTGPTGSGKTTTLYAALQEVKKRDVNIITVEDPVEYHIDDIEQIQVHSAINFTFATALRNILRHDPDVIMVGEVRDVETAKIAVESALTGHLVLTTLHTNNAASAITRLMEMGIEPYLLSSSILGVLAQRLVRHNCQYCLTEENVDPTIRKFLDVGEDEVFHRGAGCEHCNNTGYNGRFAVYELLVMSESLRSLIIPGIAVDSIQQAAMSEGMVALTENALAQARQGRTSLAEVYRVRLE
jgi:type IV pilus assembly protein PilB